MKGILLYAATVALFVLSACVPIPPEPPEQEVPETAATLSDIAAFFAEADGSDEPEKYIVLIHGIKNCIHPNSPCDEDEDYLREWVAATIYSTGFFMAFVAFGSEYSEELIGNPSMYEVLDLGLTACMGGR